MSTVIRNIPYANAHQRQVGDLFIPTHPKNGARTVLMIHGGGWNALSKEATEPIARLAAEQGHTVYSINYRLLDHAPWPACGEDCATAARFVLGGGLATHDWQQAADGRLLIAGASAGGHLAMMTGLAVGRHSCAGILSLAGPSRLEPRNDVSKSAILQPGFTQKFFGHATSPTQSEFLAASPSALASADAPPLHILHSRNDQLVPCSHSEEAAAAWRSAGRRATIEYFDGPGDLHGFWTSDTIQDRALIPVLSQLLADYFHQTTQD